MSEIVRARFPIRLKILGLAMLLLAVMMFASFVSIALVGRVGSQVDRVANSYLDISDRISKIEALVLEQEILVERMLAANGHREGLSDLPVREREKFEVHGRQVDEELTAMLGMVSAALQGGGTVEEKIELARLEGQMSSLEREHQDFHNLGVSVFAAVQQDDLSTLKQIRTRLSKEEDEYDREVSRIRDRVQRFTMQATSHAAEDQHRVLHVNLILVAAAAGLGIVIAVFVARGLVNPLRRLLTATLAVKQGKLDTEVSISTKDEIAVLTGAFNHMVSELRVKERIKETFGKYVDPRIVAGLIDHPDAAGHGGKREVVTVLFSDIQGFTSIGEEMTPTALVTLLNQYFETMSRTVVDHQGIIDKYIGDSVMAFWGPPFVGAGDHARFACFSALDQLDVLEEFRSSLPEILGLRRVPRIDIRIGLASGEVVVGNIGSETSRNYTIIGDTVNCGSRLEGANREYGTRILINEETFRLAQDAVEVREVDLVRVKGKSEAIRVYELLARKGKVDSATLRLRDTFESGLKAYRARQWEQARRYFEASLEINSQDGPARVFLKRMEQLLEESPADDWDGAWQMAHK